MLTNKINRRGFIRQSSVITAGSLLLPKFLSGSPVPSGYVGKRLVVIQLSGGNDGLNTIIPFRNDLLYKARPTLAPQQADTLAITDEVGLHKSMTGLRRLYDNGDLCIINSVGYPNPNRSHFRSMDIWQTASASNEYLSTGWLGRYLDSQCDGSEVITGVEMSDILSVAMKGNQYKGLPISNIGSFYKTSQQISLHDGEHGNHEMAEFLYKTIADTKSSAAYLFEKNKIYQSKLSYPQNKFGKQLQNVAEMIISGVESPIYYVSLSGFDTHTNQAKRQSILLNTYSEGLHTLTKDLKQNNCWDDTLVMTFSEFGRRVKENAGKGTDHGYANNVLMAGGKLAKQGLYNDLPDLSDLSRGDIKHQVDFRQVYSTILDNWLQTDSKTVLNDNFAKLNFV